MSAPLGSPAAGMADPLRMAVGTLTALPVPAPGRLDGRVPGRAMLLAPVAGVVPAGAAALTAGFADLVGLAAYVAAPLAIAAAVLATRGLHLDGLADTADGLAASYNRVKALDVMKRGDTGPAGLAAVVLVLLVQTAAAAQALAGLGAVAVFVALVAARLAVPLSCLRGVPAARPTGLGAHVAGTVRPAAFTATVVLTVVALALVAVWSHIPWWAAPAAGAAGLAAAAAVLFRAGRRLGGMTGDVIGACVEAAATAAMLVLAAAA